jgi:c-di-GMP-binding flagellar brake protein YcgR
MESIPAVERRRAPRVPTVLPILFEWRQNESDICHARGMTKDVSRLGIYCYLEQALSAGLQVAFEVVFPRELTATDPMKLWCQGQVLRSEMQDRRFGLVATIESHDILDAGDSIPESDRRGQLRIIPPEAIVAEYPGLRSVIRDLSPTGAFVEDNRPFPVGHLIDLRLRGESLSEPIHVRAIVRRVEPQLGMAVEFVALSEATRSVLWRFIKQSARPKIDVTSARPA